MEYAVGRDDLHLLDLGRGNARHDPHFVVRPRPLAGTGPGARDGDVLSAEGRDQLRLARPACFREDVLGKELSSPDVSMKQSEERFLVLKNGTEIFPRNLEVL